MDFMKDLQTFGNDQIRQRNDVTSNHDFRNALLVWLFQLCLVFFVVIAADI